MAAEAPFRQRRSGTGRIQNHLQGRPFRPLLLTLRLCCGQRSVPRVSRLANGIAHPVIAPTHFRPSLPSSVLVRTNARKEAIEGEPPKTVGA